MTTLRTKIAMGLYASVATFMTPFVKYHLTKRIKRGKEHPVRFTEKLGHVSQTRPKSKLVWIHGASVGESLSILPLLETFHNLQPDLKFLVTTGTVTSARLMEERLPPYAMHQFVPVDLPLAIGRFLKNWRPDIALVVESELWPNMIFQTKARNIPLVLLNGRMSQKSAKSWGKASFFIQDLLNQFDLILAQSATDVRRYTELGAPHVKKQSNLKFAAAPLSYKQDDFDKLSTQIGTLPVWFASSTHRGEEVFLAETHEKLREKIPNLLCIIAPRHPERGPEILNEFQRKNLPLTLRSEGKGITPDTSIYLADTLGELGLFYALSPVVVIGGSLLRKGGQNLLEPARQNCAIICGPEMQNFEEICNEMVENHAVIKLTQAEDVTTQLEALLLNEPHQQKLAQKAAVYVKDRGQEINDVAREILQKIPVG
ncbi:3-deoxy-D-manno-octulosonic acid transferase [Kiloniella sp. EL199]|uniref:3-deoxy-D-manno-octulosonic acid transferase n=1 Tax=Kiloniella sp. EL199 TaxID=2107581 RepID=UPI000EA1F040|nr:3-deoxy-D-manno-octulosonic acid transferase [Kiloniella sp. EL199]